MVYKYLMVFILWMVVVLSMVNGGLIKRLACRGDPAKDPGLFSDSHSGCNMWIRKYLYNIKPEILS